MQAFLHKLTSRKFLGMIGAVLIALGQAANGTIDPKTATLAALAGIVAYIFAEGFADGQNGGGAHG